MLGALAALLPAGAAAQQSDARQRTTETIVADGLAQLPAADAKVFNQVMGELAATGSKGVEMIAAMLVPADKGKNATFEYALNGVVAYVTDPAHEALRDDVRKGLLAAIDRCGDDANRASTRSCGKRFSRPKNGRCAWLTAPSRRPTRG